MYALEEEPEKAGRWRRLGGGAVIAAVLGGGLVFGATKVEGSRKFFQKVVQFTVVEEPPKVDPNEPPPPPPPPPKKRQPPPPKAQEEQAPPEPEAKETPPEQQQVGLDESSFSEGGNGVGFATGNTQMGVPGTRGHKAAPKKPAAKPVLRPAKQIRASALKQSNKLPEYTAIARRRGLQGMVIVALNVDATGRVTTVHVESGLDPEVDRAVADACRDWRYEPAQLEGRPVGSTVMARFKFQLARG